MPRGGRRHGAGRKPNPNTPARRAKRAPADTTQSTPAQDSTPNPSESLVAAIVDNPHGLTPRELLFVAAYTGAAIGNATKSYELAGYKGEGNVRRANACKLLTRDRISAAIAARLASRVERLSVMDGDEAMGRITMYARGDIGKVLGPNDPLSKLPEDVRLLIKSVREGKFGRHIEMYDALKANELLATAGGKLGRGFGVKLPGASDGDKDASVRRVIIELDDKQPDNARV
jgi:hypothetical protein